MPASAVKRREEQKIHDLSEEDNNRV